MNPGTDVPVSASRQYVRIDFDRTMLPIFSSPYSYRTGRSCLQLLCDLVQPPCSSPGLHTRIWKPNRRAVGQSETKPRPGVAACSLSPVPRVLQEKVTITILWPILLYSGGRRRLLAFVIHEMRPSLSHDNFVPALTSLCVVPKRSAK